MAEQHFVSFASRLGDPGADLKVRLQAANELRDGIEYATQGPLYPVFLSTVLPIIMKLLEGPPVFISTSGEQRLRLCLLEILHRLPMVPPEPLEPYAAEIVDALMNMVKVENEENAVVCMKTIMDFLRHQTTILSDRVQPFLDLIQHMFAKVEDAVRDTFDSPSAGNAPVVPANPSNPGNFQSPRPGSPLPANPSSDLGVEQMTTRPLQRGLQSFKVLAECPIIVVSLFHSYRNIVNKNVREFIPLIKNVLQLQAEAQLRAHAEAKEAGRIFTGVSPHIKNRTAFGDFITAQVKTMSFLAYLLRVSAQQLVDFIQSLPNIVVRLLKDCPRERSSSRKELLVAIRHIINVNYRRIFIKKIDELLDEQVLIGDGLTVYETMRPLAYSMLADLIHHVRDSLNRDQIRRTIEVYTRNLHDDFPGTSFQTMSAKLLLNMAESIAKLPDKHDARHYLIMILNAIGDKFAAMNRQYPNAIKLTKRYAGQTIDPTPEQHLAETGSGPSWDETDIFAATPIKTSSPRDRGADPVADNKFLFRNLMNGLKNLFYQLKTCNPEVQPVDATNVPPNWQEVSFGYNAEEVTVITKLFREGAGVFRYYSPEEPPLEQQFSSPVEFLSNPQMNSSSKEEKDLLEAFATVFHCIDPATFHEVFRSEIPRLYELTFKHTALLHIPQFFLASESTSPSFAGMLLQFLMEHLDDVGSADVQKTSVLLRLFKLSFMAVTLFSSHNEQVLLPHVTKILTGSIKASATAPEPMNYFLLLRSLFRSIGGGRFELLYKEIIPLLEMILDVLNTLILSARKPQERDLYVELCLTVPARLSNLIPHLRCLMRPLVIALSGGTELVSQGLRTLELCVDNLTADYLDPIMAPFMPELMAALWSHLRPAPYSHFHSHTTLRILGKLGGRNRRYLTQPQSLEYRPYADNPPSFDIALIGSKDRRAFPADLGIDLAIGRLMEVSKTESARAFDPFYYQQAFQLISSRLKLLIGVEELPDDLARVLRLQASDILEQRTDMVSDVTEISGRDKDMAKKDEQERLFVKLLKACVFASTMPELRTEAGRLVRNVCRHLTILEVGRALAQLKHHRMPFNVSSGEGPAHLDSRILADVVAQCLASERAEVRLAAEGVIQTIRDSATHIFGKAAAIDRLPFFGHLARTFCHNCYEEEWFCKSGGSLGIHLLIEKYDLGSAWLSERQIEFVRSLMHVIKDVPQDLPIWTRKQARATLDSLLIRCNAGALPADIASPTSRISAVCGFLTYELSHMNKHVRTTAQESLATVAQLLGVEVYVLVQPFKERLLSPIYNKPLRATPFATQIGYIDAVAYCMGLQHGIIQFNDQLNRLLMESLAVADSDDDTLTAKPTEQRTAQLIVDLRVSCVGLLSMAMTCEEFNQSVQNQIRHRIISAFFKCLHSKSVDIVEAANAALSKSLTHQSKLPKELLQHGLRPILMNLQASKLLSVPCLDGLARLLTLLTTYFKVGIGAMLLVHLEELTEPNALQKISFTLVEQNRQMKIIAAVVNIFHLLPEEAVKFMKGLVDRVMEIEDILRRTQYSILREPLIKFLNQYPGRTLTYFFGHLGDLKYGRFYAQILAHEASEPLRSVVVQEASNSFGACMALEDAPSRSTAFVNVIHVLHSVVIHPSSRTALVSQQNLRGQLMMIGKDLHAQLKNDTAPAHLRLAIEQAEEQLMEVLVSFMMPNPQNLDLLFEIAEAVTANDLKCSYSLFSYIYEHILKSDSVDLWRTVIMRCLDLSASRTVTPQIKTFAFHYLLNPILAMDVMRSYQQTGSAKGSKLIDKQLTEAIHQKVWKPHISEGSDDFSQPGVDHSRMELLQMTAMLIKYHHGVLSDLRKDIIKFGWTSIRLEDIINKHAAYVVVAYFLASYESPSRIVIQVYVALLRAYQSEGRSLVMQALELVASVLPKWVPSATDARNFLWAKWPKKILMEDSANLQQIMSIFQFLVRHPALFYEPRDQFVPPVVQSLSKIVPTPNPSTESKKLALNLVSLLWQWEQKRVRNAESALRDEADVPGAKRRKLDSSTSESPAYVLPSVPVAGEEYIIPVPLRVIVIKFLVHLILSLPERSPMPTQKPTTSHPSPASAQPQEMTEKALQLLYDLLSPGYWDDLELDIFGQLAEAIQPVKVAETTQPVKTAETTQPAKTNADSVERVAPTPVLNTLHVVRVLIAFKPNEWILANLQQLQKLLENPLRSDSPEVQCCLHSNEFLNDSQRRPPPLMRRILDAIPDEEPDEEEPDSEAPTAEFFSFLTTIASESLTAGSYVSSINILWTLSGRKSSLMDPHIQPIMKALQTKLSKDYLAVCSPASSVAIPQPRTGDNSNATHDMLEPETLIQLILKVLDIVALRMASIGEQRRPFLIVLAGLAEKALDSRICLKVLDIAEKWVFRTADQFPTLKEKTAILLKMNFFEHKSDPTLLKKYLDLVIRIYEHPEITRTELTVRLEPAFLLGTRVQDVELRNRFMTIFDRSISRTMKARLKYVMTVQNWDALGDYFWINQASQLMMGSIGMAESVRLTADNFTTATLSTVFSKYLSDPRKEDVVVDDSFREFLGEHKHFFAEIESVKANDILGPLSQLQYLYPRLSHEIWTHLFPVCWASITRDERSDIEKGMLALLTKEYHQRQLDKRPNVIQTLLESIAKCQPIFKVPPHVVKFLSRTYDAWYTGTVMLERVVITPVVDTAPVRESTLDALVELYSGLNEDDLFYGTWRRRCEYIETNAALSYEQQGMWGRAQQLYEAAQIKARTKAVPFSEGEYMLWEDHWISCAQKLQQWDILYDFAKQENSNDLLLECAWRQPDLWHGTEQRDWLDSIIKGLMDAPTPRRAFFQAFMSLLKFHSKSDALRISQSQENRAEEEQERKLAQLEFSRLVDETVQLSIRKWHQLPPNVLISHVPMLHHFQELVELHDASVICVGLSQTNQQTLDVKSSELKMLLHSWRERLPNVWDDINAWQDLVTWRQHIFQLINNTYLAIFPPNPSSNNSFAYRGYHETAWLINRFAHVARKHQLPDVCISQLSRIYTLPNIEIQEAFLKLREQAKCHYQTNTDQASGLDVIHNTNLNYFGNQHRAEFYTLKGMFLERMSHKAEANEAFGTALSYDIKLAKAWAAWGQYNDNIFKEKKTELEYAASAISCYLEAACAYKNAKSRKMLSRILWLMSLDNASGTVAKAFEDFKGETPVWYWITFIPQLLTSLSHREGRLTKTILVKIAKVYPQALYFLLRTSREDMLQIKKKQEQRQQEQRARTGTDASPPGDHAPSTNGQVQTQGSPIADHSAHDQSSPPGTALTPQQRAARKQPWEHIEEIMSVLKTAFPLMALSMETVVDQIQKYFKCPSDEDAYRLIVALLNDGLSYVGRTPSSYAQGVKLPGPTESNIVRFAQHILPAHIRRAFEADFVLEKPTMHEYIQKLRRWRDKFEEKLDRRPLQQPLEQYSPHLSEFRFQKFDDVEVPGQYLEIRDRCHEFIRIERFLPNVDLVRTVGVCHRRLRIRGHDGMVYPFAIQHPAARHCRREERITQLFRILNSALSKKKESRRRNLSFHLPLMIPLAPHIRLVQDDSTYISLQSVYEDHCRRQKLDKDEPILFTMDRLRGLAEIKTNNVEQSAALRMEVFKAVQARLVPHTVVLETFTKTHSSFASFWLFQRQFSYQLAALTFMTYVMHMNGRYPHKMSISRATGNVWGSELIPALASGRPMFYNPEAVPFRLTPNLQTLMGPLATEGIFSAAMMAIARCLTMPEYDLAAILSIFVRDEMIFWFTQNPRSTSQEGQVREIVDVNTDIIAKKAVSLAECPVGDLPANQTVIDLIARAVNPYQLAQSDILWMPYL